MSDAALRITLPATRRRVGDAVRQALLGIIEGIAAARRYERLAAMSDRDLARFGISREEVPRFVIFGDPRPR